MAHRTSDPHHIRDAHRPVHLTDDNTDASTRAYEAIVRGDYKGVRSRESGDGAPTRARPGTSPGPSGVSFEGLAASEGSGDAPGVKRIGLAVQDSADPRNQSDPSPAVVRERLRRSRIIPKVTQVACPEGHAGAGDLCFTKAPGVCAARVIRRAERP